ncbi:MAG: ComF family protein [Treponema sp.]|jgi:ComF family protein|nr:ComF family protein [Treponema sp.]
MKTIYFFLFWARNFLFPAECAICDSGFISISEIRCGLCVKCQASLNPPEGKKCNICGKPLISEIDACLSCRNGTKHSYDRLWVFFPYTGKYLKLLTEYKFNKNLPLANFLCEKILSVLNAPELKNACIVPVPPRPGKIKENGWDQVEYLVKKLRKLTGGKIPVSRCLKRRKSKIQKLLDRKGRLKNLQGRIFAHGSSPKIALIIDDVITTGSTIEACSAILKQNGAEKVYSLCLFH